MTIQLQHNEIVYCGDIRIPLCATSISQRTIIEPAQVVCMCAHCLDIPEGMRSVVVENAFDKETNNDLDN
ncbi:unnamed protein product [Heterotrigona itama]|uniref:Uncharacterized protein n=1 Tax=Heterotrigona itama TaxID=395501 RepID=A0A6V7H3W7_9HYME|nr:unnamed protein product [Heterotrigona itama]